MAHNLNIVNGKASMMYVKEAPWHGLGTRLEKLATSEEAMEVANLGFTVVKAPLKAVVANGMVNVAGRFATVRTDTNDVLGVVGSRYTIVQNKDAFRFFDGLVGEGEAMYETVGALGLGEKIWILAKLPSYIRVNGDDIVDKYLLLSNSHDGSSIIRAKLTPIRVVCHNTLSMALQGAEQEVRIRHTASAEERLEVGHKIIGLSNVLYNDLAEIFQQMAVVKVTNAQLVDYVKTLVPDNELAENHTRTENIRAKILELHEVGAGSNMSRGTAWGAYNAVTEYTDHVYTTTAVDKKLESVWFGVGAKLKVEAFDLAKTLAGLN